MRRSGKMSGVLAFALVLIVLVILLGFWRNWFTFESTESPAGDRTNLTVEVNKDKIRADRDAAETALRRGTDELEQKAEAISEISTVQGSVTAIDAAAGTLSVATEDDATMQFSIDGETQVTRDDETTSLASIQAGDRVVVVYREGESGEMRVQKVNVEESAGR